MAITQNSYVMIMHKLIIHNTRDRVRLTKDTMLPGEFSSDFRLFLFAAAFTEPLLWKLRLGISQSSSESLIVSFDIPVVKVSSRSLTSDDSDIGLERRGR